MSTIWLHGTCCGWLRVQLCLGAHISDIVSTHLLQPKENAVNALSSSNKPEFIFYEPTQEALSYRPLVF